MPLQRLIKVGRKSVPWLAAGLVLISGYTANNYVWQSDLAARDIHLTNSLSTNSDQIAAAIANRISTFEVAMRGVLGLFRGSQSVSRNEFQNFVGLLDISRGLPGIQAVAYVPFLSPEEKELHEQEMRQLGFPNYAVFPAGVRANYAPIAYIEPLQTNTAALGFDTFTVPAALAAMENTLVRDQISITAPLTLVQDAGGSEEAPLAFAMYLPVYDSTANTETVAQRRAAIRGWVDVPFRMDDLMQGLAKELNPDIKLEIYDGAPVSTNQLYSSQHTEVGAYRTQRQLQIGGRSWTLQTATTSAFEASVLANDRSLRVRLAGIALTLALAWLVWLIARDRYKAESRFRNLFAQAGDGILVFTRDHKLIDANPAALKMLGYTYKELLKLSLPDILAEQEAARVESELDIIEPGKPYIAEWVHHGKDGHEFPAEVSASRLGATSYFTIMRDLSEHKKSRLRIERLTQLYKALSATNHSIVHAMDEKILLMEICKIAVEFGGMRMAWIGRLNPESQLIEPIARYGSGLAYLDEIVISADADLAEGQGPTGAAMRENRVVIVNDYVSAPNTKSWHTLAKEFRWNSAAAFPINRGDKPFAVLNVYNPHINAFDGEAVALLTEMASDVSFALDNLDREVARDKSVQELAESEQKFSLILENVGACIYLKDLDGRYIFANQTALDLWGAHGEEVIGCSDEEFFDEETVRQIRENDQRVLLHGEVVQREEANLIARTGKQVYYWSVKLPLRKPDGSIYGLCGISTDITERKNLEASLQLNAKVFESSLDGIEITDSENIVVAINRVYTEITGYKDEQTIGKPSRVIGSVKYDSETHLRLMSRIKETGHWEGELISRRESGESFPLWLSVNDVKDQQGRILNRIAILSDLSEHRAKEDHIKFLSNYDALTHLPNRHMLLEIARIAIANASETGTQLAMLSIDVDRFKIINESLGPSVGDRLLKQLSVRMAECLRPDQTLCRQSGDYFILLSPATDLEQAAQTAKKLIEMVSQPFDIHSQKLELTISIGIAMFPDDAQEFERLIQAADAALFRSKITGQGGFQFFTRQMHEQLAEFMKMEAELRIAIKDNQLLLHYQAQFNTKTLQMVGVEALVRWRHPERGLVAPGHFIPIAEESGLIVDIDNWVMREAARQMSEWQAKGLHLVPVAINLSAVQFRKPDFYETLEKVLQVATLDPKLFELELTERIAMVDSEHTISLLEKLSALGVQLSIDDFGMGYSSLSYLKRFHVDTLKIDQSFVQGLGHDPEDEAIVNAIIGMAKGFGFTTLAEGVETQQQLEYLQQNGCDEIQGYLVSKPIPAEEFAELLRNNKTL